MTASPGDSASRLPLSRQTRLLLAVALWLVCLAVVAQRFHRARTEFADPINASADEKRRGGNHGHAEIDFGGQWVMGRMIATGHGRELYHRNRQWEIVRRGFPEEAESPALRRNVFPRHERESRYRTEEVRHDAEALMHWFMGRDSPRWEEVGPTVALPLTADGIEANPFSIVALQLLAQQRMTPELIEELNRPALGGPLYPPIQAVMYAPLAVENDPQTAYFGFQVFTVLMTLGTGLAVKLMTRGRIWWSFATIAILLYPGYRSGLDLAQNHILSLLILAGGWALAVRGKEYLGGAVWGLLAFKPVWAAAFLLVPIVMGRWRFALAMMTSAGGLILATVPVVGIQTWFDWLTVGREGAELYDVNYRWVFLSRDLGGLIRRVMLDFMLPEAERRNPFADRLCWGFWFSVLALTIGTYLWRRGFRQPTGLATGYLFLGAYLACYRFMYYDAVLSTIPLALLLVADRPGQAGMLPRQLGSWSLIPLAVGVWLILFENWIMTFGTEATIRFAGFATTAPGFGGQTVTHIPELQVSTSVFYAWDTFALLVLWAWSGFQLALGREWLKS